MQSSLLISIFGYHLFCPEFSRQSVAEKSSTDRGREVSHTKVMTHLIKYISRCICFPHFFYDADANVVSHCNTTGHYANALIQHCHLNRSLECFCFLCQQFTVLRLLVFNGATWASEKGVEGDKCWGWQNWFEHLLRGQYVNYSKKIQACSFKWRLSVLLDVFQDEKLSFSVISRKMTHMGNIQRGYVGQEKCLL